MAKVTIRFALSQEGQKDSLRKGGNGKVIQETTVEDVLSYPGTVAMELATVDADGNALVDTTRYLHSGDMGLKYGHHADPKHYPTMPDVATLIADEQQRRQSVRDWDAVERAKEAAAEEQRRAEYLAADPLGPVWVYKGYGKWEVYSGYSNNAELNAVRAVAQAEADRRNAELKAQEEADKAERERATAAKKAQAEAGKETLRLWALEHGSELARARLAEGYDCWVSAAHDDYTDHVTRTITLRPVPDEDGYTMDSEERKCPTLPEIKALQSLRQALEGQPVTIDLMRVKYTPSGDDDGYTDPDAEPWYRTEIVVTVESPDGYIDERAYLIPE